MSINQVSFTSREHAESMSGAPGIAVISITDPGSPPARLSPCFGPILRLSFFDALPADEYLPAPFPGLFDHRMARQINEFVEQLQATSEHYQVLVHCEFGISRSAAIALFVEACSEAPLAAREFTAEANQWVIDSLLRVRPDLLIDIPTSVAIVERRHAART